MQVFLELLVLLIMARAFGEGAERLRQPASAGELLAGIVLAAAAAGVGDVVPFARELVSSQALTYTADVAIFFLVFLAGIETQPKRLARSAKRGFAVAVGGVAVPFAGGYALVSLYLADVEHARSLALLTGTVLAITAVPATVKVLEELGLLHARFGETIIAAALFDDVLGLFLLAILLGVIQTGEIPGMLTLVAVAGKAVVFFAVTIALGAHVYPHVSRGLGLMEAAALEFSALAMIGLAYGLFAEALGLHWILGAFMAGLFFESSRVGQRAYEEIKLIFTAISSGFLAPLFFISIGVRVDLGAVSATPVFLAAMLGVAMLGKVLGAGLPALWTGFSRREALTVGVGMSARGAVGFVVLSIAFYAGAFEMADPAEPVAANLFSTLILTAAVTTMLAPMLLRRLVTRAPSQSRRK